jgi:hypothetical protein
MGYFYRFVTSFPALITHSHFSLLVLQASVNPREIQEESMITNVYMDDTFIITGDNNGLMTLRQRKDGQKLYSLNTIMEIKESANGLLDFNLDNRVNCIDKIGRWVFAGAENSKVAVYDLTAEKSEPVSEYVHPKGGSVREMMISPTSVGTSPSSIMMTIGKKGEQASKKHDVAVWAVKLPGLEFFSDKTNKLKNSNTLTLILYYSYKQISGYLQGIEKQGEDVTEFTSIIQRVEGVINQIKDNPKLDIGFSLLKNLQNTLDQYETLMEKLSTSGALMRFFTSSRLRRNIEMQNSDLHR